MSSQAAENSIQQVGRNASKQFCQEFRNAFSKLRKFWPNVSTEFRSQTLMEGWFEIDGQNFPEDAMKLMKQFDAVAAIIDESLKARTKTTRRGGVTVE